ncbi:uncharacterized protein [Littorina saxatilis]|uniref:uncharacterized protein isoform X1 n=1 Tax=Littorina saxatilis TaxID=31220 RepID=UPI0038B438C5
MFVCFCFTTVSCEFGQRDMCDWTSVTNETNTLEWIAWWGNSWHRNYYARLYVGGHDAGDQGVLASPWLQPWSPGSRCRLQFQYYLGKDNGCRLSLLHEKAGIMSVLWNSTAASFYKTASSDLDCTGERYKLYFKGERISNEDNACGYYNEIAVDNIVYYVEPGEPPTSHPTTVTTSTLTTSSNVYSTQQGGSTATDALTSIEGLGSASIAGITIAVILVVVVIAVVVIFVSRRRNGDGDKTKIWLARYFRKAKRPSASQNNTRRAVSNSGYVPDDQFITSVRMPGAQTQSDEDTDHIYNAPEEPYVNLATAVNSAGLPKHTHQNLRHPGNNHSQDAYELATTGDQTKEVAKNGENSKQDSVYEFAEPPANEIKSDGSHDYYNQTNLKVAQNEASASDPGFDDTYDHTQARPLNQKDLDDTYDHTHDDQVPKATPNSDDTSPRRVESPNDEDEYAVPPTKTMSNPTTGKAAAIADGSRTMHASKQAARGKRTAAKGKPGYENITEDHTKKSADKKQARLQDDTEYSLAENTIPAQSSPEASQSEASVYEVVDHDEDHDKSTASVPADDIYNELDVRGESVAEQKVQQRHYDHVHDPDEYSELHGEDWTRDQQREAEADQYNHIHNC